MLHWPVISVALLVSVTLHKKQSSKFAAHPRYQHGFCVQMDKNLGPFKYPTQKLFTFQLPARGRFLMSAITG